MQLVTFGQFTMQFVILYYAICYSPLQNMALTSVGIAVAAANLRRKTGISIDLGIWIK